MPAKRYGRFIRGDLWLIEDGRPLGLMRFRKEIPSGDQRALLAFDKDLAWADQIRFWWLVGGTDHRGKYGKNGGRLACVQCSRTLHVWQPGRLLGVECETKHPPPVNLDACRQISEARWLRTDGETAATRAERVAAATRVLADRIESKQGRRPQRQRFGEPRSPEAPTRPRRPPGSYLGQVHDDEED